MRFAPYTYVLLMLIGVAAISALVAIDRWIWNRQQRNEVDATWQSFSSGRWHS